MRGMQRLSRPMPIGIVATYARSDHDERLLMTRRRERIVVAIRPRAPTPESPPAAPARDRRHRDGRTGLPITDQQEPDLGDPASVHRLVTDQALGQSLERIAERMILRRQSGTWEVSGCGGWRASLISLLIVRARPARVVAPISAWARSERAALASGETPAARARSNARERR